MTKRYRIKLLQEGAKSHKDVIDEWLVDVDEDSSPVDIDGRCSEHVEFVTSDGKKVSIIRGLRNNVIITEE